MEETPIVEVPAEIPQTPVEEKEEPIDYVEELKEVQKQKEDARLGYAARHAIRDVEEGVEPIEEVDNSDMIAEKVIQKILPVIQSATQSNLIEKKLDDLAGGNDALKKLIEFHMDNSVNPALSLNERAEAAYAIANKKVIDKKVKEINLAQKNRAQIASTGEGGSTDSPIKPGDNVLSEIQLNKLKEIAKANNWNDKATKEFIEKTKERLASSK
jgi:hypothetical protein